MSNKFVSDEHPTNGIGGKACSLIRLHSASFHVPDFVVIPYFSWQGQTFQTETCWPSLQALCYQLELAQDPFTIGVLAASLREAIRQVEVPQSVTNIINEWVKKHRGSSLTFVRSSAASEDSSTSSSAGQYESVLSLSMNAQIEHATLAVIESYYSLRAVTYRQSRGISHAGPQMGVILQQAIQATAAGIIFGCDPLSSNNDVMVIEACFGLGTTLVSGAVTPDRYIVDKRSKQVLKRSLGSKKWCDQFSESANIERIPTTDEQKRQYSLRDDQLRALISEYLRIESVFGPPQDVEWAYETDALWLLQSRPVTTSF